jgi:hypothetical protein
LGLVIGTLFLLEVLANPTSIQWIEATQGASGRPILARAAERISADDKGFTFVSGQLLPWLTRDGSVAEHATPDNQPFVYENIDIVYYLENGRNSLWPVSVPPNLEYAYGENGRPAAAGHRVVFESSNPNWMGSSLLNVYIFDSDVYLRPTISDYFHVTSRRDDGLLGDGPSRSPSANSVLDIAFESDATNLVSEDTNGTTDVFMQHFASKVRLVSRARCGTESVNGVSTDPALVAQYRDQQEIFMVAFVSDATDLTWGATPSVGVMFMSGANDRS